jgi:predicted ATPase/signal transduction histidine kinase
MNPGLTNAWELLRSDHDFTLYRARTSDSGPVLALTVAAQGSSTASVERLAHQWALAPHLHAPWAARPLEFQHHEGRPLLIFEDAGGDPLDSVLARSQSGRPLDLNGFLQLAINLANALEQVHRQGLIHRDLKPANVLVDQAYQVRLIGFGIASRKRSERQLPGPPELIVGSLPYMSPEQTGRMNRSLDTRSDLYSLGVTLYELGTGQLPFAATDAMELIHCHIARQPKPPSALFHEIPAMVDAIVLKLLAKSPEDRYRTAAGVEADLRVCLAAYQHDGQIAPFELARHDASDRLSIPEKLYGREEEIHTLLAAFERVVATGRSELVLVSGYSGIGKSSLVSELHKVLVPRRGLFAKGKYEQFKRDIPHASLAQAFQGLLRQLLNKSDAELARRRAELLAALGPNGQLMSQMIPELVLVIGEPPGVPEIEPQSAQNRFFQVFRSLVGVFAKPGRPLVLFIDDLQWLDVATLHLLQRLITDPDARNLLLIGAYRDNEVGSSHPLQETLASVRGAGAAVSDISLGPLQLNHLARLSADALHSSPERTQELAQLLSDKTGGNPFFATQFITELAEEGQISFDRESATWCWNIATIQAKGITDNLAELMSAKLGRLSSATRETLAQLACLGNVADAATVASMRGDSEEEVHASLYEATEAGLVAPSQGSFAFTHDRIHEAARALIPQGERAAMHLRIARTMSSPALASKLEDKLFELVHHYERALPAIDEPREFAQVAELYLRAGKRAKAASAFASAQAYFASGLALLGDQRWHDRYALTLALGRQLAECEIVLGALPAAEHRLTDLAQHAIELGDRADVVCLTVLLYFTTGRSQRAVEIALAFLASVGVQWPLHPVEAEVRAEYDEMKRRLALRPIELLPELAEMNDARSVAVMAVLTELFPAAYAVDRYLMELVLLRMTNLSLEQGHCESSIVAYSALNMALGEHFADYQTAFYLGELACSLAERRGVDRFTARVYSLFPAFTMPWIKHLPLCQPMMRLAFEVGSSMGDMAFAAYDKRNLITHLLVSGLPLAEVEREAEQAVAFCRRLELGMPAERFIRQLAVVRRLQGLTVESPTSDDAWGKQSVEGQPQLAMMVCYHWVFRLQECFFSDDLSGALEAIVHAADIRWAMRSSIEEAEYDFYAALTRARACEGASSEACAQHRLALKQHHERIALWAENCPENFAHRHALVGAELARLEGRPLDAQALYEDAVQSARKYGFTQGEALASELAAEFHLARRLETIADAYLRHARACFERWGAVAKLKQLDARYPQLHARTQPSTQSARDAPIAQLDVRTVDKASQTLSSEMELPSLLEKLMRLAVEHAGAERGLLILIRGDELHVEAEATVGAGSVQVTIRSDRVKPLDVPVTALQYVLRTRERLVLDDASREGLDQDDPYVRQHRPRSVLCLPVFKQTQVVGTLYLENNLTSCAFTADRVAVLDFLASQAAIALENARLYSDLQRSEALLREAQHLSSTGSFWWRISVDALEFSEQTYRIYDFDPAASVTLEMLAARVHPEDRALWREVIDTARRDGSDLECMYRVQMPDRSVKFLHLVAHGARDDEGETEYIGAIQDVTQRHLAEETLSKVRAELAHVARVTSLGVLTASIAHEVSQPLSGIVTNASTGLRMLAATPPNVAGAIETVRRTIRDGHRASEVITRLRALFGRKESSIEAVDLNETTREVLTLSRHELQSVRVALRTELSPDLPRVRGDRVQLQQVILNLLLNATDAMSGVEDRARVLVIRTDLDQDERVCLSVQDAGVGFDPSHVHKLFEAFYSTKVDGMGMGLSVSRSIIESHHGRLWATSNAGDPGATFSFSLPCATRQS